MITLSGLHQRAALIQTIRRFFIDRDYLEVDTPVRLPAVAPEHHIEPEPADGCFLQTSPELCMKRLLAAGAPKLFQICHCFRKGERGNRHLAEFTMLEWYRAGIGYQELMDECEELLRFAADALGKNQTLAVGGNAISLDSPWPRLTVAEAFARYAPFSMEQALAEDMFDEAIVVHIEPHLGVERPAFLYDYPASLGALARLKPDDPAVAERFELYIGGLELANGFSELTDHEEQRQRFAEARKLIRLQGRDPGPMPEPFLNDLQGMPEAAGIALGIDRLAMVFAGAATIDEVVPFRPEDL